MNRWDFSPSLNCLRLISVERRCAGREFLEVCSRRGAIQIHVYLTLPSIRAVNVCSSECFFRIFLIQAHFMLVSSFSCVCSLGCFVCSFSALTLVVGSFDP